MRLDLCWINMGLERQITVLQQVESKHRKIHISKEHLSDKFTLHYYLYWPV